MTCLVQSECYLVWCLLTFKQVPLCAIGRAVGEAAFQGRTGLSLVHSFVTKRVDLRKVLEDIIVGRWRMVRA